MRKIALTDIKIVYKFTADQKQWSSNISEDVIAYQLGGRLDHYYGGRLFTAKADSVFFIDSKDHYDVIAHEFGPCIAMHFALAEPLGLHFSVFDGAEFPQLKSDFYRLLDAWNRRDELSWCDCASIFYSIMSVILNRTGRGDENGGPGRYENIVRARDHLAINFSDPDLSIDSAAKLANLGPRRFGELFAAVYHTTPGRYLTALRIKSAEEMLRTRRHLISEVSAAVGYSSPSYFTRVFTREVGVPPGEWMKNGGKTTSDGFSAEF